MNCSNIISNEVSINQIENFIKHFHCSENITEVFTQGCCYWFADILQHRFGPNVIIMYDQIDGHFGAWINDHVYDITGDVTNKYNWAKFSDTDENRKRRIYKDCINF